MEHECEPFVHIRNKVRCTCGHRVMVPGQPHRQTREQPPWTWPFELLDRWRTRVFARRYLGR